MVPTTIPEHVAARLRPVLVTGLAVLAVGGARPAWSMDQPAPAEGAGAPSTGAGPESAYDLMVKLAKLEKLVEAAGDRVVQKTRPDTGETYVASAYPIP